MTDARLLADTASSHGGGWGINAGELRTLLDALRAAVGSRGDMPGGIFRAIGVHEQSLEAVRTVLNAVAAHAFTTRRVAAEVSSVQYPAHEVAPLCRLIQDVYAAWLRRVRHVLGADRIEALQKLLKVRVPDFLGLLEISKSENRHSAILRWLLDHRTAPAIAPGALRSLARHLDPAESWTRAFEAGQSTDSIAVVREYTIAREWTDEDRPDRIDIVIIGRGFILAIENKVKAREHGEQTRRYWEWLEPLPPLRGGLFLSPSGVAAASPAFRSISYFDLLGCLLDGVLGQSPTVEEELVMASYVRTLSQGILRSEVQALTNGGYRP